VAWSSAVIVTAAGAFSAELPWARADADAMTGNSAATANSFKPRRRMYFIHELAFACRILIPVYPR
jgi:hypothetical protein